MTEHVITRWYRPPELMLCPDGLYSYAVDMWSCGTILAEMLGRNPLFPGKNFIHQLTLIFDVIGSPEPYKVSHIKNGQARKFLDSQISKKKRSFNTIFPNAANDSIEVLEKLLVFDPNDRLTIDETMNLKYITIVSNNQTSNSLIFPEVSNEFEFSFERNNSTKAQLKSLILNEVISFHEEKYGKPKKSMNIPTTGIVSRTNSFNTSSNASITERSVTSEKTHSRSNSAKRSSMNSSNNRIISNNESKEISTEQQSQQQRPIIIKDNNEELKRMKIDENLLLKRNFEKSIITRNESPITNRKPVIVNINHEKSPIRSKIIALSPGKPSPSTKRVTDTLVSKIKSGFVGKIYYEPDDDDAIELEVDKHVDVEDENDEIETDEELKNSLMKSIDNKSQIKTSNYSQNDILKSQLQQVDKDITQYLSNQKNNTNTVMESNNDYKNENKNIFDRRNPYETSRNGTNLYGNQYDFNTHPTSTTTTNATTAAMPKTLINRFEELSAKDEFHNISNKFYNTTNTTLLSSNNHIDNTTNLLKNKVMKDSSINNQSNNTNIHSNSTINTNTNTNIKKSENQATTTINLEPIIDNNDKDQKKKKFTIAKSPKFSKMSWERKAETNNPTNVNPAVTHTNIVKPPQPPDKNKRMSLNNTIDRKINNNSNGNTNINNNKRSISTSRGVL